MNVYINSDSLAENSTLPIDGISGNAQTIINEVTEVYQCSRDIVLAAMYSAVGVAVGKNVKVSDGKYFNYPCLWICAVAPSGSNKSTPIRTILQPLKDRDTLNYEEYRQQIKEYKDSDDENKTRPIFKQLLLSDSTPEARNQVLSANDKGILLYRDEIKGFLDDIGRYTRSGEVSQLLSVFDSDNIVVNRKSDDTLLIKEPFMSILGTIQPDVLSDAFGRDLLMSNGFNQRWLFVYPDETPTAMYSDSCIRKDVLKAWNSYISELLDADFISSGCDTFYLMDETKKIYIDYYNRLQLKKQEANNYMGAVYSKLQIIVERWACITHLLGVNAGMTRILPQEMEYSVRCMNYFERCAERVYNKLLESKGRTTYKEIGNEEMIARVYYASNPKSQTAFADALGISKQFVSKCLKKYPKLTGCQLTDTYQSDNQDNNNNQQSTSQIMV